MFYESTPTKRSYHVINSCRRTLKGRLSKYYNISRCFQKFVYHHFKLHVFSLLEISCRRRRLLTASCTRDDQQQTSHAEGDLLAALNVKYLLNKATVHPNDEAAAFLDCRACFLCSPRTSPAWDALQQAEPSPGSSAEDIPVHLARGCSCMLMLSIGWSGRSLRIGVG